MLIWQLKSLLAKIEEVPEDNKDMEEMKKMDNRDTLTEPVAWSYL